MNQTPKKEPFIDKYGNTSLHITATDERFLPILKEHLTNIEDPNIKNFDGETPLDAAEQFGVTEARELLIKYGAKKGKEIRGKRHGTVSEKKARFGGALIK